MRTQHAVRAGQRRGGRRAALGALPVAALVLMTACGSEEEPDVQAPPAAEETSDAAPTTEPAEETDEATTDDGGATSETAEPTTQPEPTTAAPTSAAPTTTAPTEEPTNADPTTVQPPEEGAGDGEAFAQQYIDLVASGDTAGAYGMLSPEAMVYYPDQTVFEENGIAGLSADLADASGEPQMAIRSAYEETHNSAQVVSLWGEDSNGEPWAQAFAIRKLDGASWVIDQEITRATGQNRLNWLNPGIQEGVEEWEVNPDQPITFALLKHSGPNVAVTASINGGDEVSQQLTERPTDGAVMYELSDSDLPDGPNVVTASWVAEDEPFVHTSATPASNPS